MDLSTTSQANAPDAGEWSGFVFTGSAREYFDIWIVDVLLSVLTLGVWSAWAKVRRLQYFYGHTRVLRSSLDYLASPWVILKGRILAVVVIFVSCKVIYDSPPSVVVGYFLMCMLILPLIVCESLRFNARNTVWRHVRFDFRGTWGSAVTVTLFYFVSLICLLALIPLVARVAGRFWADNHSFGTADFRTNTKISAFYVAAGWCVLVSLPLLVLGIAVVTSSGMDDGSIEGVLGIYLIFFFIGAIVGSVFRGLVGHILVNGLDLDERHFFRSSLTFGRYTWIILSNVILILCTLGLAYPWAAVRLWRYTTETLSVRVGGDPDALMDSLVAARGAFGS